MKSQDGSAVCGMTWGGVGVALGDIKGHPFSAKRHRMGRDGAAGEETGKPGKRR